MELIDHTIAADGVLFLRWRKEDGGAHRGSRIPGDDLSDLPMEAQQAIGAVWTTQFIADWQAENTPPPPTLDESKAALNAAITAKREAVFAEGYTPSSGTLAGHTLQVRNETDKTNWLTSAVGYSAAVQAGHGAVEGATFRTQANETIVLTYAEAVSVLLQGMQVWGQAIMQRSWALKDEIDAAEDEAELTAIDINTGWPG